MSKVSVRAKVDFVLEMIENIEKIIQRHNGIVKALDDYNDGTFADRREPQ